MSERLCQCGHDWSDHAKPKTKASWDACSFPCLKCDCAEYDSEQSAQAPPCPACEAAARELADIAAVLRTGSSGDTLLGKEVSRWIDTAHAVEAERDDLRVRIVKEIKYLEVRAAWLDSDNSPLPDEIETAERGYRDVAGRLRALLAETEANL